jgi:hypothetical protein
MGRRSLAVLQARTRLPAGPSGNQSGNSARCVERGSWLARLEAPAVSLKATVLEGSDERTLGRAAGHIECTALPGEPGNIGRRFIVRGELISERPRS